ncbi:MAG: acetyltransferase [Microbacteriaceae bacterium]|nr:acetyltransferase [Microbacteriaceae bacterium]
MQIGSVAVFAVASPYAWDVVESVTRLGKDPVCIDNFGGADERLPLTSIDEAQRGPFVIGLSSADARADAAKAARDAGFSTPIDVVDPTAIVASTVVVRHGAYVNAGVVIGSHAMIGCHCNVNRSASIGHDSRLGFAASVGPGAVLAGGVIVMTRAFVGSGATILPGITIGRGATVGAGAVVTRNVDEGAIVVGNPATVLRRVEIDWTEDTCPHCATA